MGFRNTLLTISLIIIAFSITLYFQTDQNVQTINWDQYQNLQYDEERSHSLKEFNNKISPLDLTSMIEEIEVRNKLAGEKTRVMELGTGNGRVLMELKKIFPDVEFYGVNREKSHTFYRRESYILSALKFGIFSKNELEEMDLPYVVFLDLDFGGRLPYDLDKFDVVFSQNLLRHIKYKFELFNEILRVLKPGGVSIHADVPPINIYDQGVLLPWKDALARFRRNGVKVKMLDHPSSLRFKKPQDQDAVSFPVTPHHPIPANPEEISPEMRRQDMGYKLRD